MFLGAIARTHFRHLDFPSGLRIFAFDPPFQQKSDACKPVIVSNGFSALAIEPTSRSALHESPDHADSARSLGSFGSHPGTGMAIATEYSNHSLHSRTHGCGIELLSGTFHDRPRSSLRTLRSFGPPDFSTPTSDQISGGSLLRE